MRLLILHISDLHVKTAADWVISRASRIADAVRDVDYEVDLCVLTITGDITYSGLSEQYAAAEHWLKELARSLAKALPGGVPVKIAMIPGNHDCDLQRASAGRAVLIDGMLKDGRIALDHSIQSTCVQPQAAFFEFRDSFGDDGLNAIGPLYYEYRFPSPKSDRRAGVLVRCCNTAWVSQNPEVQGKMFFPESLIPSRTDSKSHDDVVVTILHHPYNWLESVNARAVRRAIQNVSDLVLTGHEHAAGIRQQQDEAGGKALYIEGLTLYELGPSGPVSEFYAVIVDTDKLERRVLSFEWKGNRYEEQKGPAASWATFESNPLKEGHLFPLSESMRTRLSDPGISLAHPTRGPLTLDDIFVYPDLTEIRYEPTNREHRVVRGEELLAVARESGRMLVTGTDEAGKTTLAKRLFVDCLEDGCVPLLLSGRSARLRGDQRDRRELARIFEDQYDADGKEYLDTSPEKRVILFDDFTALESGERPSSEVLEYLCHFADLVVIFAHDVAQQVLEIAGLTPIASGRIPFSHYRILPVSHIRREEMINLYVSLATDGDIERDEHLRADMRRILSVALGKYYAPPVPVSVISILQARAFNDQLNLSQSTYGYFYELLIKRALLSNTSQQELDVRLGYLTDLAFAVYKAGTNPWTEDWMMNFHREFVKERKLAIGYRDALDTLLESNILSTARDGFTFKYRYIYYYFVSRALAARLTSAEGQAEIRALTQRLDEPDPANILLFLTHHSKDAAIIDPMLARAEALFQDVPRADLSRDSVDMPAIDDAIHGVVYVDTPVAESRQQFLKRLDDEENSSAETITNGRDSERDIEVGHALGFVSKIYVSFRTMQILGQLLKNFPGTLSGDQKDRITRAVYGVALRTLGAVQQLFRTNPDEHAEFLVSTFRREHPDLSADDLVDAVRATVYWQLYQTAFGVTQRTAGDVGSNLLDPVFNDIEKDDPVPAIRLISSAIRLDRAGSFPEDRVRELAGEFKTNPLALRVLRGLVITHFHLFEVDREIKQRTCKLLNIEYKPSLPRSRRRLIQGAR